MSSTFILLLVLVNFALAAVFIAIMLSMCQAAKHGDEVIESHFPAASHDTILQSPASTAGYLHSQTDRTQPGATLNRKRHNLARWLAFHHALR